MHRLLFYSLITPKAFANFSPGLERSDNPGRTSTLSLNPERVRQPPNPFRVASRFENYVPRVLAMLEPWAQISERLRRKIIKISIEFVWRWERGEYEGAELGASHFAD